VTSKIYIEIASASKAHRNDKHGSSKVAFCDLGQEGGI